MSTIPAYSFDEKEATAAYESWGCNCGPAALATILGRSLDEIREPVEQAGFATRGYLSPTMMLKAIELAGAKIIRNPIDSTSNEKSFPTCGLARIQWTGPWTAKGANPKWAYGATHWVASWRLSLIQLRIFDINGGIGTLQWWEDQIATAIVASIPRADGGWYVTHSWEVTKQ